VLEAGSSLGFMVFPALEPHESYYIEFQGEGQYLFTYFQSNAMGKWILFSPYLSCFRSGVSV